MLTNSFIHESKLVALPLVISFNSGKHLAYFFHTPRYEVVESALDKFYRSKSGDRPPDVG